MVRSRCKYFELPDRNRACWLFECSTKETFSDHPQKPRSRPTTIYLILSQRTFILPNNHVPDGNHHTCGSAQGAPFYNAKSGSSNQQPASVLTRRSSDSRKQSFNPQKHLNFEFPSKIYTMKEIGFEGRGISPNAVTAPFQLFTEKRLGR